MRRVKSNLLPWLLGLAVAGGACECADDHLTARLAELEVVPDPVDFGEVPANTMKSLDVTVRNIGTAVVQLKGLSVSENPQEFSLTLPEGLDFPRAIPPGNQVVFTVNYLPLNYPEDDHGTVLISSTDKDAPEYELACLGRAVQPVLLVQPVPVDFGSVRVGATGPATLSIKHTGSQEGPVSITAIGLSDDGDGDFSIEQAPPLTKILEKNEEALVNLAYRPHEIDDADRGELHIESDAPSQESLNVPLQGSSHAPAIVVEPLSLDFGTVQLGSREKKSFFIRSQGNDPLTIRQMGLSATGSQLFSLSPATIPDPIQPLASQEVAVTYLADYAGDDDGQVIIQHDDPLSAVVFVQLHGRTPCQDIDVVPDHLTIRLANQSHSQVADIEIFNRGDAPLQVEGLDFSNPDGSFSIVSEPPWPATVDPAGNPAVFQVQFEKYQQTADDTCQITVHSDDPDEESVVVTVIGVYTP